MKLTRRLFVVSGSRDYPDRQMVDGGLRWRLEPGDTLMHGAARGVDSWAAELAARIGCRVEPMPADWSKGRKGGILRNHAMLDRAATAKHLGWDVQFVAFWDGRSPGTRDAIQYAKELGFVPVIYSPEGMINPDDV